MHYSYLNSSTGTVGEALSDMLSITADLGSAIQIILDVEREVSQREEIAAAEDDRLGEQHLAILSLSPSLCMIVSELDL